MNVLVEFSSPEKVFRFKKGGVRLEEIPRTGDRLKIYSGPLVFRVDEVTWELGSRVEVAATCLTKKASFSQSLVLVDKLLSQHWKMC